MNDRGLLDTNPVIAFFAGDAAIVERLGRMDSVLLTSVVLGELYFGACKSGRVQANLARIEEFAASCTILGCDAETARQYGRIKGELHRKGRMIPENDLWIAAIALQHGLTLITRDAHFGEVDSLMTEPW